MAMTRSLECVLIETRLPKDRAKGPSGNLLAARWDDHGPNR
jgi:hypothetical protein